MDLEQVFEIIRKEPVCLFIGSGFSLYAGMPTVSKIKNVLYHSLTLTQQNKLDITKDLRRFTEDYATLVGRSRLIKELQELFKVPPVDTHIHDLLARISYFKTIITTNYDQLIENSMFGNASVIANDQQVFGSPQSRCRIFKIHGDIDDGKSIVITSDDYAKQYNRTFKDPFWASVISELSSKHIIFIGYGYEDENVWADFEHIDSKLKSRNKKRILISPRVDSLKRRRLKQLKIDYVQANGEDFVNGLIESLKENIVDDFRNGIVDMLTAQEFITSFDMKVDIQATKDKKDLINISKVNGVTNHKVELTTQDPKLIESYNNFTKDYSERELKISPDQINNFSFLIEGFKFMGKDALREISVLHMPKYDGICKVKFVDSRFTINELYCKLFNSIPGKLLIEMEIAGYEIKLNIKILNGKPLVKLSIKQILEAVAINKSYKVFKALSLLMSGKSFELILHDGTVYRQKFSGVVQDNEFEKKLSFFNALKKIEKFFNLNFPPINLGCVLNEDINKVAKLEALINQCYYAFEDEEGIIILKASNSLDFFKTLGSANLSESYVCITTDNKSQIELFGRKIFLGKEQIFLNQPKIAELNVEDLFIRLKPSDNIIVYRYERFGLNELNNEKLLWSKQST